MTYCEDYPACGHNLTTNTCDPKNDITEPQYCDICGFYHHHSDIDCESLLDED